MKATIIIFILLFITVFFDNFRYTKTTKKRKLIANEECEIESSLMLGGGCNGTKFKDIFGLLKKFL